MSEALKDESLHNRLLHNIQDGVFRKMGTSVSIHREIEQRLLRYNMMG